MKLSAVITSFIILLIVGSCRKEVEIDPTQESFPIRYYFINASAGQLNAVNLTTNTYFPKIDKTTIYYKSFLRVRILDSLLITVDTSSATKSLDYTGCKTQLEVNVIEQRLGSIFYVSTWLTKQDSIRACGQSE